MCGGGGGGGQGGLALFCLHASSRLLCFGPFSYCSRCPFSARFHTLAGGGGMREDLGLF